MLRRLRDAWWVWRNLDQMASLLQANTALMHSAHNTLHGLAQSMLAASDMWETEIARLQAQEAEQAWQIEAYARWCRKHGHVPTQDDLKAVMT